MIGGLAYRGVRTYGNAEAGLSVEFKSERSSLSIYLYTNGHANIPEGPAVPPG